MLLEANRMSVCFNFFNLPIHYLRKYSLRVVNCPPLSLQNGEVEYDSTAVSDNRLIVGTRASFTCQGGYSLSGSNSSTCDNSGHWSESTQTCNQSNRAIIICRNNIFFAYFSCFDIASLPTIIIAVTCETLSLGNGTVTYNESQVTNQGYPMYTNASLSCDHGYNLSVSNTRICQTLGHWHQESPTCNQGDLFV